MIRFSAVKLAAYWRERLSVNNDLNFNLVITQSYHTASEDLENSEEYSEWAFVFHCRKQAMQVLNNVKVSKWWIFSFRGNK